MKLVKLYPHMSPQQVELVTRAEFGGLVNIRCSKLNPELCKYLMSCFNPTSCQLVFPGRGSILVSEDSVYRTLGVPWGNEDVIYEKDKDSVEFMLKQMGRASNNQPKITFLEKKLAKMTEANWTYLRLWTVLAMCSVLAPTTGIHISPRIYPSLCNIKEVNKLNIPKFVIWMIREAAKSGAERGILKSCVLYFMVGFSNHFFWFFVFYCMPYY